MLDTVQNTVQNAVQRKGHDFGSPYEAMLRDLNRRGLSSDKLLAPTTPEDLSSRNLFPHEQSREPGLYDAALTKYEKVHETIRFPSHC